jgi:2-keto-3-deoxygluconate permease
MAPTASTWRARTARATGAAVRRALAVPGVAVLLPLLAGAAVGTWVGRGVIGPFTLALSPNAALTPVALMLVCVGAQISPRRIAPVAGRVGVVLAGATLIPTAVVLAYSGLAGPFGYGGVSVLAAASCALGISPALWVALAGKYGQPPDAWGGSIASAVNSGPMLPLLLLSLDARRYGVAVPWMALLDALAPLLIGFLIGLVGRDTVRPVMRAAIPVLMAAFSFQLGARLHLPVLASQLPAGVVLGLAAAVLSGGLVAAGYVLLLREPAAVGWGAAATTIGAPIVPAVVAAAIPAWRPLADIAAAQVGVAVVVSSMVAVAAAVLADRYRRWRHRQPALALAEPAPAGTGARRGDPATAATAWRAETPRATPPTHPVGR